MNKNIKYLFNLKYILTISMGTIVLLGILPTFEANTVSSNIKEILALSEGNLVFVGNNSLFSISKVTSPDSKPVQKVRVIATAYSSSVWQTDDTPFITAAGTRVRDGIVANNYLPFGTKIKIPDLFGDKIFTVEDRMNWRKGNYQIDIWFPSYSEAKNFGAQTTHIEILEI